MKYLIIGALGLSLTACAKHSTEYSAPEIVTVETKRVSNKKFDKFWDEYVEKLAESFFVINNISKESRIINVSFSTNTPSDYIDCGKDHRTSFHPTTGEEVFDYNVTDDSIYNMGVDGTNFLSSVTRITALEGRANLYIAPYHATKTQIKANAKYVFKTNISGYLNTGHAIPAKNVMVDFTSTQPGIANYPSATVTCASNGKLESRLLGLIQ